MEKKYDFSGWATRANLKCSDGRVILKDAFKDCDGQSVPLVWNHQHNSPDNILGHAMLENREDGVYAYCSLNDTESGKDARLLVEHGDIYELSIYANKIKQQGVNVVHGAIREVSLVLAGANPGAFIESVVSHGDGTDEEAVIFTGEEIEIAHTENNQKQEDNMNNTEEKDKTIGEIFDTLTEEQKNVVYALISQAIEDAESTEGDDSMKHNVFEDGHETEGDVLSHSDMEAIFTDAKNDGSLRNAVISHGVTNLDYLFPDAQTLDNAPSFIKREDSWVTKVMNSVHHTPFSRIRSIFADITEADARAKGYIKGNLKVEEVFSLLKRETGPTTVYKTQKLHRDDVVDITDFDVVVWIKTEMRMMLNEEFARAYLIGDGRSGASNDKINEQNIRPIWKDDDLFTIKVPVTIASGATSDQKAKAVMRAIIKARKNYKGSGNPTWYTTEDWLTDLLLMEDTTGRIIYDTPEKLATAMRLKEIVTVPAMENQSRVSEGVTYNLAGLVVNLADYNVGADKGGAVNLFDDFDIDYNKLTYLIESRCSGALTKPYSAMAIEVTFQ
jgi:HK97 family phage prohead protease